MSVMVLLYVFFSAQFCGAGEQHALGERGILACGYVRRP